MFRKVYGYFVTSFRKRNIVRTGAMASPQYEPETHRTVDRGELQQISDDLGYDCSPALLDAVAEIGKTVIDSLKEIDKVSDFVPETKYPRLPGHRPEPEDRCGNAWAWKCDIQGSRTGVLSGLTVAIKDNCAVAGVPMSNGSRVLQGYVPEYDATVVTRILDAGGRVLGKASCDDFCLSATGLSSVDGFISLPSCPGVRVGGSSGGSAVLVAEGQVDVAIAADQGGSIRIPAAWTGCVGLKPTWGLVPYTGLVSIEPTVDHVGPIALTVTKCAQLLQAIAGHDGMDGRQPPSIDVPDYVSLLETMTLKGKTLGVLKEGFESCVEETQVKVKDFIAKVAIADLVTSEVSVPLHKFGISPFLPIYAQGGQANFTEGTCSHHVNGFQSASLEKAVRQGLQSSAPSLSPSVKYFTMVGELLNRRYGNHYYAKSRNLAMQLTNQYDEALKQCDVIVMPTLTHVTVPFTEGCNSDAKDTTKFITDGLDMLGNTAPTNVTEHPALTLPLGKPRDGHTSALMIVGRKFDEVTVLGVARALEKLIPERGDL